MSSKTAHLSRYFSRAAISVNVLNSLVAGISVGRCCMYIGYDSWNLIGHYYKSGRA